MAVQTAMACLSLALRCVTVSRRRRLPATLGPAPTGCLPTAPDAPWHPRRFLLHQLFHSAALNAGPPGRTPTRHSVRA
eukprot:13449753-Alexandrium_andersonii.AAC.1